MKNAFTLAASLAVATCGVSLRAADPGAPEDNGLLPVSETIYVNTLDLINNGNTESLGVAIARNGNVLIGWEDDGDQLTDLAAVWTLYGPNGQPITEETLITTIDPAFAGLSLSSRFLSYFRSDGTAIPGRTAWGPKIKANLFGEGVGMGATAFDLGIEVVELKDTQFVGTENAGDFPAVQLLSNAGAPQGIASGLPAPYAQRPGDVRIADWDYLSNGNIVIAGESRQDDDLVNVFGGSAPNRHAIFRIVTAAGAEVKAPELISAEKDRVEMWHGVGVTKNGFGFRFRDTAGRAAVRLFNNAGTPLTSTNIDLGLLSGSPVMELGGRGDGVGFHGNGNDAYAAVARGLNSTSGQQEVWVTVLNADGSLRWARNVSDDVELQSTSGTACDVGIDASGRVVVVYNDSVATGGNASLILGRLFDAQGNPLGGTFYVSERELPDPNALAAVGPRVSFRGDSVAVVWESQTGGTPDNAVVGARFFGLPAKPGTIESVGLTRIVPDTVVINQDLDALGNWEPYVSVLGTSTFLVEANAFAEGTTDSQRYVVALQPAAGGAMTLGEGFFADNGTPFRGVINASRQNGNPGRVAGDARPGATRFVVGGEASPHVYEPFQSDNRWTLGYDRLGDGRYATVQFFDLNPSTLAQSAVSKAIDSANGRLTSGVAPGSQITRYGGDVVALSNGSFVSLVEDRSLERNTAGNAAVATVFGPDGSVVKESFLVANGDQWANLAAVQGGFVVRTAGVLYFYDNAGNLQGSVDQNSSGESFDRGRGDGTRIAGHINQPFVFLAGKVSNATVVRVAAWDARTREFVAVADVSEGGFRGDFDRATVAADALGRVVVSWVAKPDGYEQQQVAARILALNPTTKTIAPLTGSFLPFINAAETGGIRTFGMSVAMTTRQVLVAAKGEINLQNQPAQGANSPREINFYTVFTHPNPQDDPTPPVGGSPSITATATLNGNNVVISWTGGTAPFKVQRRTNLNSGSWTDVMTTSDRTVSLPVEGTAVKFQVVGQ